MNFWSCELQTLQRAAISTAVGIVVRTYDLRMSEVPVSEARSRLAEVIDNSRRTGEPVTVTRRGRRVAVILGAEAFDRLVDSADELADRRELAATRTQDDYLPWNEVKAALGLR